MRVVPLEVLAEGGTYTEGVDLTSAELLAMLQRGVRVTTSQPAPAAFAAAYAQAAADGAREVVSVHLSGELSGTVQAARLAANDAPVPVHVVDSRLAAMALGFTVLEVARFATTALPDETAGGRSWRRPHPSLPGGEAVAAHAATAAAGARAWFLVDSLDHLRRGGRLSTTSAAIGTVLGLRPLLTLSDGAVVVAERVRTRRAARERLEAVAAAFASERGDVRVAVHHLGEPEVAQRFVEDLGRRIGSHAVELVACEASAVVAAHVGPGVLAVVVADA
ncbi:DegV family protein [Cellulomonas composti]|uniref:DegV domain-containing protein n=1 Tax=Cellulomonas composti TaxID=266130 RepID=A0A511JDY1_9CELL|nr:DegV family protein [Cellulomonas composti]GEL96208.1 DegV domain-containing protein [Cellulomonas composti]